MANSPLDPEKWLDSDPSRMLQVEEWIILSALHDYDFWLSVVDRICLNPENGKDIDDFDVMERNIIFHGVRKFWNMNPDNEDVAPNADILQDFLNQESLQGNICSEDEIPETINVYKQLLQGKEKGRALVGMSRKFMPAWLSRKRARYIGKASRSMSLDALVTAGEKHSDVVSSISSNTDDIILYGKHPRYSEPSGQVNLQTLQKMSESIGGFYRGDAYMFQSPTGGGKTVMATQLMVDFVTQGLVGVFISTEQPWKEIEPRIISNTCDIPISTEALRNRFDYKALSDQKSMIAAVDDWEKKAANKFVFFHWNADNTQSVRTDLEATLRKAKILLGKAPDFVILDWIGGALGSDTNSDNLRFVYQTTADAFASAALKHQFIGIAFAQSKADKVYFSLGSEQLAECKTMHRKFTALIGITAIEEKEKENEIDDKKKNKKYQKRQFLDVAKARKGEAARIAVDRQFDFQRFLELGTAQSKVKQL